MKKSLLLKNLIILIIAPILAVALLYIVNDFSWLTASVLDIAEVQKIQKEGWDIAYKSQNQSFEVFWSEKIKDADTLNFEIIYNPEKIDVDVSMISWYNYAILDENSGYLKIQLSDFSGLSHDEWWFEIPFSWDETQILLWEGQKEKNWNTIALSIGNLTPLQEHSLLF